MITIILIEPEHPGNVGAVCRLMKNFGLDKLVLIDPKCDHRSSEAIARSKHAKDILDNAIVEKVEQLKNFDYLVATTAQLGSDYNIPRSPLTPEQLAGKMKDIKGNIAIVFGREGTGLTNEEIKLCDFTVTIPSSTEYPALNLSHSVGIILYEIFKVNEDKKINDHIIPISKNDKDQLLKMVDQILDKLEFATEEKKDTQKTVWKKVIGKSMMTKREAFALMGFLRKLL